MSDWVKAVAWAIILSLGIAVMLAVIGENRASRECRMKCTRPVDECVKLCR